MLPPSHLSDCCLVLASGTARHLTECTAGTVSASDAASVSECIAAACSTNCVGFSRLVTVGLDVFGFSRLSNADADELDADWMLSLLAECLLADD